MQLDFVAVVDIPAEFARGCPSTAWSVGNMAACHHWMLGYYEPDYWCICYLMPQFSEDPFEAEKKQYLQIANAVLNSDAFSLMPVPGS